MDGSSFACTLKFLTVNMKCIDYVQPSAVSMLSTEHQARGQCVVLHEFCVGIYPHVHDGS